MPFVDENDDDETRLVLRYNGEFEDDHVMKPEDLDWAMQKIKQSSQALWVTIVDWLYYDPALAVVLEWICAHCPCVDTLELLSLSVRSKRTAAAIASLPSLTKLYFDNSVDLEFRREVFNSLKEANMKNLRHLKLDDEYTYDFTIKDDIEEGESTVDFVGSLRGLRRLDVSFLSSGLNNDETGRRLMRAISSLRHLRDARLASLLPPLLPWLSMLRNCSKLSTLEVLPLVFNNSDMNALMQALSKVQQLETLAILIDNEWSTVKYEEDGIAFSAAPLAKLKMLRSLRINNAVIPALGEELATLLASSSSGQLARLDVRCCVVGDDGFKKLASAVMRTAIVERRFELLLSSCIVEDMHTPEMRDVMWQLERCPNLSVVLSRSENE